MTSADAGAVEHDPLTVAWRFLTSPARGQMNSFVLPTRAAGLACRVAVDHQGARHVLIPAPGELIASTAYRSTLRLDHRRLRFAGDDTTYLDLSCSEAALFSQFDDVVRDALEAAENSETPGVSALRAVDRWRRLLRSPLLQGLSSQAAAGLFAELSVLRELRSVSGPAAVTAWEGPFRSAHDFEAPKGCLEVKAIGSGPGDIVVHGVQQLDTHDGRTLDLVLVEITPDPEGVSLADLIDEITSALPDPWPLRKRLAAAGWAPEVSGGDSTFHVGTIRSVRIAEDVPRIVASSFLSGQVPDGVHAVEYRLDTGSLLRHSETADLETVVRRVAS